MPSLKVFTELSFWFARELDKFWEEFHTSQRSKYTYALPAGIGHARKY